LTFARAVAFARVTFARRFATLRTGVLDRVRFFGMGVAIGVASAGSTFHPNMLAMIRMLSCESFELAESA
jgi:hypothetical protein